MPLDLGKTILQLDQLSQDLRRTYQDRQARLDALLSSARGVSPADAVSRTSTVTDRPFMAAQVTDALLGSYAPTGPSSAAGLVRCLG